MQSESPKLEPLPKFILSLEDEYLDALWSSRYCRMSDEDSAILKQKLKNFCQFFPHQAEYENFSDLFTQFELDLIDKGNANQASAMLRQTLTPAQKAALKKVIRESGKLNIYEVKHDDDNEIWTEHYINVDALISELTGD